jgi:hypothetical protein
MSTQSSSSVAFPTSAVIGRVEQTMDEFFRDRGSSHTSLILDLSACEFIEVASLTYLISFILHRQRQGLSTILRLPTSKEVRDFLRAWNFPAAIKEAIGVPFSSIVSPADYRYFGENLSLKNLKYAGKLIDLHEGVEHLLRRDFFAFTSIKPNDNEIQVEAERWQDPLLKAVLDKHLQAKGYLASRVIYESLTNASRHPAATVILATSHFERFHDTNFFTVVLWDNGEGIVETLQRAISNGNPIRSTKCREHLANYNLNIEGPNSETLLADTPLDVNFTPSAETDDAHLLAAALLPGITRDVGGSGHRLHKDLASDPSVDPSLFLPGMGLYVLTNAVIDLYGGVVSLRSGRLFMNVKGGSVSPNYRIKIRQYGDWLPPFLGNMLTLRLPLIPRPDSQHVLSRGIE